MATLGGNPAASVAWLGMAVIMFLGLPMWLFALFGGSLAFAIADILCDIVISEGDTHEVGSAEDSDAEEGVEMAAGVRTIVCVAVLVTESSCASLETKTPQPCLKNTRRVATFATLHTS